MIDSKSKKENSFVKTKKPSESK